jgi:hypothetical protein
VDRLERILQEKRETLVRNRKWRLSKAIEKMKFVRIELLSRMHLIDKGHEKRIPERNQKDYLAKKRGRNELKFPTDNILWSDDLYHLSAQGKSLCSQSKRTSL